MEETIVRAIVSCQTSFWLIRHESLPIAPDGQWFVVKRRGERLRQADGVVLRISEMPVLLRLDAFDIDVCAAVARRPAVAKWRPSCTQCGVTTTR